MLLYLVFTRYDTDGAFEMYYAGNTKTDALNAFTTATGFVFDATLKTGNLYFICFDTSTAPGSDFSFVNKTATEYHAGDINVIVNNINRAVGSSCLYTHVPFCNNTKLNPTAVLCDSCIEKGHSTISAAVSRSAYGKLYCPTCWDDYIHPMGGTAGTVERTDGLVEYVIGVACGTYSAATFTDEEKDLITAVWQNKKAEITNLPEGETLISIETKCAEAGLILT